MKKIAIVLPLACALASCSLYVSQDEGRALKKQIDDVRNLSAANEVKAAQLAVQMDSQLKRLKSVVDEATKVVTRNSADVGQTVEKLQTDLGQVQGRLDDLQHGLDALTKQFQDYRAASDTKLEQLTNTMTAAKNPPIPDTPDALFSEADKRLAAAQWADARRLYEAFVNRYPTDARASKAQYDIGEAYGGEKRWANAIGAYTKVVDNFPKAEIVPDAMYKNGLAFYQLKYCSDARVYFQELIRRYPHTSYKRQASEQIRSLQRDARNKNVCAS